jgi:hypothetical protein
MPITDWIPGIFSPTKAQTGGLSSEESADPCDSESPKTPSDPNSPLESRPQAEPTGPTGQRYTLKSEPTSPAESLPEASASSEKSKEEVGTNLLDLSEYSEDGKEQFPGSPFGSVLPSAVEDSDNVGLNPLNHPII